MNRDNSTESHWRPREAALDGLSEGRTGFTERPEAFCVWESFPLSSTSKRLNTWKHHLSHMDSLIPLHVPAVYVALFSHYSHILHTNTHLILHGAFRGAPELHVCLNRMSSDTGLSSRSLMRPAHTCLHHCRHAKKKHWKINLKHSNML